MNFLGITSEFLEGNDIERGAFVRPPPVITDEGKIWKLQKCIYGQNGAAKEW